MDVLFGFLLFGIAVTLTVILPIVSFVRAREARDTARQTRDILRQLLDRVDALETRIAWLSHAREAASPAAPAAPVPPTVVREAVDAETALVPESALGPDAPDTPLPASPPIPPKVDSAADERPDFEQLIGGRWLLYAGVAAVVLGMSYFVKFAFDNGWVSERLRIAAGVASGLALLAAGMRFSARGLALFGQALAGGGIVVLYLSIYAALHFYGMIGAAPAFVSMVVVTAGAAWVADRQRSQPLAALALLGGFATPLLVGGERDAQVVLFTYIAILIAGSAALARRHAWPLSSAIAYGGTFVLVVTWFFAAYEPEKWLRTELFLTLYVALFGYLLRELLRAGTANGQAQIAVAALATAPFVYHFASLILLNDRPGAWLVYLVLFTVAGLILSQRMQAAWVRLVTLVLVALPQVPWIEALPYPRWYAPALVTVVVVYGLHLAAQSEAVRTDGPGASSPTEIAHAQLNGLALALTVFLFLEDRASWLSSWVIAGLSAWNAALAGVAARRAPRLRIQFVVLSATLAAAALVLAFDGPVVPVGWMAEGVFLGWLAVRERSRPVGIGSAALIVLASMRFGDLLVQDLPVGETPFFNPRALAAAIAVALLAWMSRELRRPESSDSRRARDTVILLAHLLTLAVLSADIHALFVQRALDATANGLPHAALSAQRAQQVTLSTAWAAYAVGLIAVGMWRRYAPSRYLGILLFAVTVVKILARDLDGLDRFYRMISVLAVGVLLLAASYLYQRRAARH